ncbi:MAG: DUF3343 domain-containing protein [Clostridia bacterium]|nr:DUF3343 domain-containing protein [Clostridia bacterium]
MNSMLVCTASMASQTYALKAQKALSGAAIPSRVVRLDGAKSKKGCSFGVEFPCGQKRNVENVLSSARIRVKHYYQGDVEI